jgi:hypothetical protein
VKNSIYQESISNPNGVHWDVKVGRYRIVRDNLIQCSHGTILTPWTIAFVANVAPKAFVVKQKKLDKENTLISALHLLSSTFIDTFFTFGFGCVPCGGCAFKLKSS